MMSKEMYKQRLETLRTQIKLEKSLKKTDAAHFAKQIKSTTLQASKDNYKKSDMARTAAHDHRIEMLEAEVERTREMMKRVK